MNRRPNPVWLGFGVVGWLGLIYFAVSLWGQSPRAAGFDLELLLQAGRDVASGISPYEAALNPGGIPEATNLFYSYPPPVAQVMSLVAGVPSAVMFGAFWIAAMAGLAGSAVVVARRFAPERPALSAAAPVLAVAPLVLPFSIAVLFGNLDALFPFAYAVVLVAASAPPSAEWHRTRIAGGAALSIVTLAKIQPGALGGWFVGRVVRERLGPDGRAALVVLIAAATVTVAALVLSLLFGGVDLWRDYVPVAAAASDARLLDPRNVGAAAQIGLLVGGDEGFVRALHLPIAVGAVIAAIGAGVLVRDRLTGVAIAGIASILILPITWYHYPTVLIPFAIAAVLRAAGGPHARVVAWLVTAAGVVATLSIAWVPALWLAVGLGFAAVVRSTPDRPSADAGS